MHLLKAIIGGASSYVVPEKELQATGCFKHLSVKRTTREHLCDSGLQHLKNNLATCLYENGVDVALTTENKASGNLIALAMPDAIASMLPLTTRFISLLMLQECSENTKMRERATNRALNAHFVGGWQEALPTLPGQSTALSTSINRSYSMLRRSAAVKSLVHPIINDLLATDHSKAQRVLETWLKHFHDAITAPEAPESNMGLDEYIRLSEGPAKKRAWTATLYFALGVHLHESELGLVQPVMESALDSITLTEDYWGWPTISQSANNVKRLSNVVAFSMAEHQCSDAEAKDFVKGAVVAAQSRVRERKEAVIEGVGEGTSEVVLFLDALEHFAAGNSIWCSTVRD